MTYVSKSPAELVKDLIPSSIASFVDSSNPWKLMVGKMVDSPNQQIGIYDAPGQMPDPKWLLDYPAIQVIVRGEAQGYQSAFSKMRDVYDFLLGINPQVNANGDRIDSITQLATPSLIGYDTSDRPSISANFRLIVEPAASSFTNREPL